MVTIRGHPKEYSVNFSELFFNHRIFGDFLKFDPFFADYHWCSLRGNSGATGIRSMDSLLSVFTPHQRPPL